MINPHVSADCVVFGFDGKCLNVLLIEQEHLGQVRHFALPGDHVLDEESLDDAANRVLYELTSLKGVFLHQCGAFGDPNRVRNDKDYPWLVKYRDNPKTRVITVAYFALVKMEEVIPSASSFAHRVFWQNINDVPELAFDHDSIYAQALEVLRREMKYRRSGFELLPEKFTLSQLQTLHEAVYAEVFDKRNFRKKVLKDRLVLPLEEKHKVGVHKPARLYEMNPEPAE